MMGAYCMVTCDSCRVYYRPVPGKEAEILLSDRSSAAVGRFVILHRGCHALKFRRDEYDLDGWPEDLDDWKRVTEDDLKAEAT